MTIANDMDHNANHKIITQMHVCVSLCVSLCVYVCEGLKVELFPSVHYCTCTDMVLLSILEGEVG